MGENFNDGNWNPAKLQNGRPSDPTSPLHQKQEAADMMLKSKVALP
jgi:hypothetical protein